VSLYARHASRAYELVYETPIFMPQKRSCVKHIISLSDSFWLRLICYSDHIKTAWPAASTRGSRAVANQPLPIAKESDL